LFTPWIFIFFVNANFFGGKGREVCLKHEKCLESVNVCGYHFQKRQFMISLESDFAKMAVIKQGVLRAMQH